MSVFASAIDKYPTGNLLADLLSDYFSWYLGQVTI